MSVENPAMRFPRRLVRRRIGLCSRQPIGRRRWGYENLEERLAPAAALLSGATLSFTAAAGEANRLTAEIVQVQGADYLRLTERGGASLSAGAGLVAESSFSVRAPLAGVMTLDIQTGDRDDEIILQLGAGPTTVHVNAGGGDADNRLIVRGGEGDDTFLFSGATIEDPTATTSLTGLHSIVLDLAADGQDTAAIDRDFFGAVTVDVVGGGAGRDVLNVTATGADPQKVEIDGGSIRFRPFEQIQELRDGAGGVDGISGAYDVAISPDGRFLYAGGQSDNAVAVFRRDVATGQLTYVTRYVDGTGGVDGLLGVTSVTISPDGAHLYAAGNNEGAVAVFTRNPSNGLLTFVQVLKDGQRTDSGIPPFIDGLEAVRQVVVSPDGTHVYAASFGDDAVAVFSRDASTGRLTFRRAYFDGVDGIDGLDGAYALAVSPDGKHVVVAGRTDDSVVVFRRSTGHTLVSVQVLDDGVGGVNDLDGAASVAFSADGRDVYLAAEGDGAITQFVRDSATGVLTQAAIQRSGAAGAPEFSRPRKIAVSPDGERLYCGLGILAGFMEFDRDVLTGSLTFSGINFPANASVNLERSGVAISPDSRDLYSTETSLSELDVFRRTVEIGHAELDSITIQTGSGDDTFHVRPLEGTSLVLDGSGQSSGDTLVVDERAQVASDDGATFTIESYQPIAYAGFETVSSLSPMTFVVNTDDDVDDGVFDAAHGSLREAIHAANAHPGTDIIAFALPGAGPYRIRPLTRLPSVQDAVIFDGASQGGFAGSPLVEIDGSLAGAGAVGLLITGGDAHIESLVVGGFSLAGVAFAGAGGSSIEGSYLGAAVTGQSARANGVGVIVADSRNNRVGGTTAASRNLISGNGAGVELRGPRSHGNAVQGNFIGVNASGLAPLANGVGAGAYDAGLENAIGGAEPGQGNIISGNSQSGVQIDSTRRLVIQGNSIGTDAAGGPLGNGRWGVFSLDAAETAIGGTESGAGNTIAHNGASGVLLLSNAQVGVGNSVLGNSIHNNAGLGIALGDETVVPNDAGDADFGVNNLQNFPLLGEARREGDLVHVGGSLSSTPGGLFRIEFFASRQRDPSLHGEGERYLGYVEAAADATGAAAYSASFDFTGLGDYPFLSATATDSAGNSSQFSLSRPIAAPGVTQITENDAREDWSSRHSSTAAGMTLWFDDADNIYLHDGATTRLVQADNGQMVSDVVFTLGTGAAPGKVIAAWRRGDNEAWVWTNDGSAPRAIDMTNPFDPNNANNLMNPEGAVIADGLVLMALQAFDPNTASFVRHIYRIDPDTADLVSLTGDDAVFGYSVDRFVASGGQGAWMFDDGELKLHFYDGQSVRVIDTGPEIAFLHLARGRLVYEKPDQAGVRQIHLYDSLAASPVSLPITRDAQGGNFRPLTDGRHIAWLHGTADGRDLELRLWGGLSLTDPTTAIEDGLGAAEAYPFHLHRGQAIWIDALGQLRFEAGLSPTLNGVAVTPAVDVAPSTSFDSLWFADALAAWLGESLDGGADLEVFRYQGPSPGDMSGPAPPMLVTAVQSEHLVTVAWDRILGAEEYTIYYAPDASLTPQNWSTIPGAGKLTTSASSLIVPALSGNKRWTFRVAAVEGGQEGPASRRADVDLFAPRFNAGSPFDVNRDGRLTNADAMIVIDFLRDTSGGGPIERLGLNLDAPPLFPDVDGNNFLSAGDALGVVSALRGLPREAGRFAPASTAPVAADDLAAPVAIPSLSPSQVASTASDRQAADISANRLAKARVRSQRLDTLAVDRLFAADVGLSSFAVSEEGPHSCDTPAPFGLPRRWLKFPVTPEVV